MLWLMAFASFISGQFFSFFLLFMLVLFHEAAHGLTARCYHWDVTKLTLLPFGGQLEVKKILNKPVVEELAVAVSGPLFHLIVHLAILCFEPSFSFIKELYYLNLQLMLFNLLPVWPLDGGRIIYCLSNLIYPFKKSIHISIACSLVSLLIILFYLLNGFQFQWMLLYMYTAVCTLQLFRNRHFLHRQFLLEKWESRGQKEKVEVVEGLLSLQALADKMHKGRKEYFILLGNEKMLGKLSDDMIIKRYFSAVK